MTMVVLATQFDIVGVWVSTFAGRVFQVNYNKTDSVSMLFALGITSIQHVYFIYKTFGKAKYRRGQRGKTPAL